MKIGILGAGISGLSIAKLLSAHYDVEILERDATAGGIAKTRAVYNIAYHPIGGHCFNSKYQDVLDFVFDKILDQSQWNLIHRNAGIQLNKEVISYPIEFAVSEIAQFDQDLAFNITKDFLNSNDDSIYDHLEMWFRKKFGNTLSEKYFLPYNKKIWNCLPSEMDYSWVKDKLPIPDQKSFFLSLFKPQKDKMPHQSFYYPKSNDQSTFINSLAKNLHIMFNYNIESISFNKNIKKWKINDEKEYDLLISTLPLNIVPSLIKNTPDYILTMAKKLKYNKVTTMLWETKETTKTWTYIPQEDSIFHRYIHIGNFFKPNGNYSITESIGVRSYEEMLENGKKDPFLLKPIDYNVSDHAYVVYDKNHKKATSSIINHLKDIQFYTLGRFGEWEYYNMDMCIKKSLELYQALRKILPGE
jgi:protoporphyrinogen oxidase